MEEKAKLSEEFELHLLERYNHWLTHIEAVHHEEVVAVKKELSGVLTEAKQEKHARILGEIVQLHEKVTHLSWLSEHLKILHDLSHTFSKTYDEKEILAKAFELVSRVMRTDAFFIAFYDEGDDEINISITIDDGVNYGPLKIPYGEGIISKVIATRETVHLRTSRDETVGASAVRWGNPDNDTNTCIFVPLMLGNQMKGVISAQSYRSFAYKKEHEELLKIIGSQVASAVETARLYDRMYQMSFRDELTGILNYRAFHRDLENLLSQKQSVALIMLDSDHLKKVNDRYGHHVGDALISCIAEALKSNAEPCESVYRYAGDEFMFLSPGATLDKAMMKVQFIREYLHNHPLIYQGKLIPATVSVGIALSPDHAHSADGLKRAADEALYRSKNNGKNCATVYGAG
ncbi:sensor domain-containing diguanylate cyclase [Brevibacillus ruminantium]|uniref:Sensor domain-containing diguanylate cyclase n=1 Tax=Brevibacillus ruminantium TaxID=2950604 RepID=A0ABY4WF89_9BACL|nr:sensor domain-containing diguanylate cyclase [Brevibacillus ruminantium]USG64465.1 sensor domain-containing diguanylate cyclase [Brevibacillus ruminantium]